MVAVFAALLAGLAPRAPAAADSYQRDLEPLIQAFLRRQQIPGLAIAIVRNNRVVYARGFGRMSLGRTRGRSRPSRSFTWLPS